VAAHGWNQRSSTVLSPPEDSARDSAIHYVHYPPLSTYIPHGYRFHTFLDDENEPRTYPGPTIPNACLTPESSSSGVGRRPIQPT
jgi:hypothetical protein